MAKKHEDDFVAPPAPKDVPPPEPPDEGILRRGTPDAPPVDAPIPPQNLPDEDQVPPKEKGES